MKPNQNVNEINIKRNTRSLGMEQLNTSMRKAENLADLKSITPAANAMSCPSRKRAKIRGKKLYFLKMQTET